MPFSIWISGTNGKTTTTNMLTMLLKKHGAISGGNIGVPLANMDKKAKIWVLESSSFTLHYTKKAKPNIYILLPVTKDHLSWHKSFDNYLHAKIKPLAKLQEGELALVPKELKKYVKSKGFIVYYKNSKDIAKFFDIDLKKVRFDEPFLLDALLSLAVSKALFNEVDYELINSYTIEPHKMEKLYDKMGNLWIDDSKATNVDATLQALKCYKDKKIFLILGGDDKGVDLNRLFKELIKYDIKMYAIGTNSEKLNKLANKYSIKSNISYTLEKAVQAIINNIDFKIQNCIALLSPAASSLDQYNSYSHRGEEFKKHIIDFNDF